MQDGPFCAARGWALCATKDAPLPSSIALWPSRGPKRRDVCTTQARHRHPRVAAARWITCSRALPHDVGWTNLHPPIWCTDGPHLGKQSLIAPLPWCHPQLYRPAEGRVRAAGRRPIRKSHRRVAGGEKGSKRAQTGAVDPVRPGPPPAKQRQTRWPQRPHLLGHPALKKVLARKSSLSPPWLLPSPPWPPSSVPAPLSLQAEGRAGNEPKEVRHVFADIEYCAEGNEPRPWANVSGTKREAGGRAPGRSRALPTWLGQPLLHPLCTSSFTACHARYQLRPHHHLLLLLLVAHGRSVLVAEWIHRKAVASKWHLSSPAATATRGVRGMETFPPPTRANSFLVDMDRKQMVKIHFGALRKCGGNVVTPPLMLYNTHTPRDEKKPREQGKREKQGANPCTGAAQRRSIIRSALSKRILPSREPITQTCEIYPS